MADFKPVVFKLENELYGLDINKVQGIEKEQQVVHVPNTASYIKGIMNLRGEVIPVYSLRKKFGMSDVASADVQYIIVRANGSLLVFILWFLIYLSNIVFICPDILFVLRA